MKKRLSMPLTKHLTNMKNQFIRYLIYIVGLFINALGIVLSTYTGLGVACVTCLCTNAHNLFNISLGLSFSILYVIYVFLEFLILKKDFGIKNLLQAFFAFIFGYFTDFIKTIIYFEPTLLFSQLLLLTVSLFIIGLGVVILINCDLVPSAPDGFVQVVSNKLNRPFGKIKVYHDVIAAAIGILLGLIYGKVEGLGIATIIAALSLGRIIGFIDKHLKTKIQKICHIN